MAKIQLVLLDFDGTLVDTAPDLIRTTNLFLKSRGQAELPEEAIRKEIGFGLKNLLHETFPDPLKQTAHLAAMEQQFLAIYENELLKSPRIFPGAMEFLESWPGLLAIVSNKRHQHIVSISEHLGLHKIPWVSVIGGDSFEAMKPDPIPFLEVMKLAGTEVANTLMVGDGEPDIEGARTLGMRSVAVSFGYSPLERLVHLGATATISEFSELGSVIAELT